MAGQFAIDLSRFVEKAKGDTNLVVRKIGTEVFRRVILKTPVHFGRARGSWNASVDQVTFQASDVLDKSGGKTIAAMVDTVAEVVAGDVFYLTSNLPYIIPLEHGHSKQAPAGMVATTLIEFPGIVQTAAGAVG